MGSSAPGVSSPGGRWRFGPGPLLRPAGWRVWLWFVLGLPHGLMLPEVEMPVKGTGAGVWLGLAPQQRRAPQKQELSDVLVPFVMQGGTRKRWQINEWLQ